MKDEKFLSFVVCDIANSKLNSFSKVEDTVLQHPFFAMACHQIFSWKVT